VEPVSVTDTPERTVSIRLALEDVVITESRYAAGERGPDLHVHRLHTDSFHVLAGTFTLSLTDGDHTLAPGTFGLVPPHVVHAFRNDGPDEVRFLNMHAPGVGFDRYVQEIGGTGEEFRAELAARFDQHPPPADGGLDPAAVIVLPAGEGERLGETIVKVARPELSLLEFDVPPGGSVDLHFHKRQSDSFYVLDGELEFQVGRETVRAAAGALVLAPAEVVHCFRNVEGSTARLLNIHAPGGFAEYRRALAELRNTGVEPDDAFFEHHDVFD
jgi:quercetin dioxygenase-like cupin family protein